MPTLSTLRNAIDTWLENRWPTVTARQATYFTNQGRYWQGLVTHIPPPSHTNSIDGSVLPNRMLLTPTDQVTSWADVLPEWVTELMPAAIWIDVYLAPAGAGYVASIRVTHNGTLYQRSQNVGPETARTKAWHQVIEFDV